MKRLHVHVSLDDLAASAFLTSGESTVYGDSVDLGPGSRVRCCEPKS